MKENRIITIDEEIFRTKAFEVMDELINADAATMSLTAAIIFPLLQQKLFYPEKEFEEKEQEQS